MVLAFLFYWGFEGLVLNREGLVLNREGLASLCSLPLRTASPFPFARRDLFVGLATAQSATAPLNAFPTKRDSNGAAVAGHL